MLVCSLIDRSTLPISELLFFSLCIYNKKRGHRDECDVRLQYTLLRMIRFEEAGLICTYEALQHNKARQLRSKPLTLILSLLLIPSCRSLGVISPRTHCRLRLRRAPRWNLIFLPFQSLNFTFKKL